MKAISLFLAICVAQCAGAFTVKVSTTSTQNLENEPVIINLNNYPQISNADRNHLAVFVNGKQISSQIDDMNADGIADELVFLATSTSNSLKAKIKVIPDSKRNTFPQEVYAEMLYKNQDGTKQKVTEMSSTKNDMYNKMHHHGVAWESALVGYRIYFDNKSTIDVYDKKTPQLELEACQWYPDDEQLAAGFGDDILRVSGSAGVGAVKAWNGKKALHIDKFDKRTQRIVTQGNLRTVCETEVEGWQYEGKKIDMTVRYIQYARHRDCLVEVYANQDIDTLATGVQKVAGGKSFGAGMSDKLYWTDEDKMCISSLGYDWPVNDTVKYAKEQAGLGLIVEKKADINRFTEDKSNNLVLLHYKKGEILRFRITAVSSKPKQWTVEDFRKYIEQWQTKATQQIIIK